MPSKVARSMLAIVVILVLAMPLSSLGSEAWGNGSSSSVEFTDFGIHDITCDIALRTATYTSPELLTWMTDWYIRNETDWGYSFDEDNLSPSSTDNINAYTDDPDSYWKDWDNHTLYLHPRAGWDPADGDAARRVSTLYNQTRYHIYQWLMNGSVRYRLDQHYAAYYGGLMSHYVMDITQFGHTDWTRLDHSNPPDHDPDDATYHSYYEAKTWTDKALRHLHMELMSNPLPQVERVTDPARTVRDLAEFVNGRHGPDVQFDDIDQDNVTLGSTYVYMLETFVANWDRGISWNGARGYDQELWNMTLENLVAGMNNLTNLWTSAYLDAHDMFMEFAADIQVGNGRLYPSDPIYEGMMVGCILDVTNNGRATTPSFKVLGTLDDQEEIGVAYLELIGGWNETVSFSFYPKAGNHTLTVIADVTQGTPETNESNNIWSINFTVLPAPPAANLSADPPVLELLQEDTGVFNITLENLGYRDDIFDITIEAYPGTIDFSITLGVDKYHLRGRSDRHFHIDVATFLDNPVGPRTFTVTATGTNSSASINLTVIIKERQVAPYIEVEYGFFTNVSVPMTFDASKSWDHNGDALTFTWDFGDGQTGSGAIIEHAYEVEGVYVIRLNVSDGLLHRDHTLEVSVEGAIPRELNLAVTDVDFNAARFQWATWNNIRYFKEYRLYLADRPDAHDIVNPNNLVHTIYLSYVDNVTLRVPPGDIRYVVMETVNIYGDAYRTNVAEVALELRTFAYPEDDILHDTGVYATSDLLSAIELGWREWQPLIPDSDSWYVPSLISTNVRDSEEPVTGLMEVPTDGVGYNNFVFEILDDDEYMLWVDYMSGEDMIRVGPIYVDLNGSNWSMRFIRMPATLTGVAGKPLELSVELPFVGKVAGLINVDWGDGTAVQTWHYSFEAVSVFLTLNHTYSEEGNYTIRINDTKGLTIVWTLHGWHYDLTAVPGMEVGTSAGALAVISAAKEDPAPDDWWDYIIAIGLILFIATIGVLVGHLTGYYRIGREHEGKDWAGESEEEVEDKEEPEPTAEEIISELEEELGGSDGSEEYFDHEPTVAELEEMIPRERED